MRNFDPDYERVSLNKKLSEASNLKVVSYSREPIVPHYKDDTKRSKNMMTTPWHLT